MNDFFDLVRRQVTVDTSRLVRRDGARRAAARAQRCQNVVELRQLASRMLPRAVFDFVDGAAADEVTARQNEIDFGALTFLPRAMAGVANVNLSASVLGQAVAAPLIGAPTGLTGLVHPLGEVGIARALHASGSIYVASAMASYSIEELTALAPGPTWFQLYIWRDRGFVRELVERARAAGHLALVLTVDVPHAGPRERDQRNGFGIPPRITLRMLRDGMTHPRWSVGFIRHPRIRIGNAVDRRDRPSDARSLTDYINSQFDPSVSWQDFGWLRELWSGPLVVKGILRTADAEQAVRIGADAVVVSNHGGRQLDHTSSTIRALPAIVDAVGSSAEVYVDGGVRRGADVAKALAIGARACLVGRPLVFGLGAGGEVGVRRAVQLLIDELRLTLLLLGCPSIDRLDRSWLGPINDGTRMSGPSTSSPVNADLAGANELSTR